MGKNNNTRLSHDKITELQLRTRNKKLSEISKNIKKLQEEKEKLTKERKELKTKLEKNGEEWISSKWKKALLEKERKILEKQAKPLSDSNNRRESIREAMDEWIKSHRGEENSNLVKIKVEDKEIYVVTHEINNALAAIAYQIGRIEEATFYKKIHELTEDIDEKISIIEEFDELKKEHLSKIELKKTNNGRDVYVFGHEKNDWYKVIGNDFDREDGEPAGLFPYQKFIDFVHKIAPQHQFNFIKELNNEDIAEETDYLMIPAKGKIVDNYESPLVRGIIENETEVCMAKDANNLNRWKDSYLYQSDSLSNAVTIKIKNGLEGWITFFYEFFANAENKEKLAQWYTGADPRQHFASEWANYIEVVVEDWNRKNTNYTEVQSVLREGKRRIGCLFGAVDEEIKRLKLHETILESRIELKRDEIASQNWSIGYNDKSIQRKDDQLADEYNKISNEISNILAKKREKLALFKADLEKEGFDWNQEENVLKALRTKQILLDIAFLEPDDKNTTDFEERKKLSQEISARQDKKKVEWSLIAQEYLNSQDGVKSVLETGDDIGLEVIHGICKDILGARGEETSEEQKEKLQQVISVMKSLATIADDDKSDKELNPSDTSELEKDAKKIANIEPVSRIESLEEKEKVSKGFDNKENWFAPKRWLTDYEIDWAMENVQQKMTHDYELTQKKKKGEIDLENWETREGLEKWMNVLERKINNCKILPAYQFYYVSQTLNTTTTEADAHLAFPELLSQLNSGEELVFIPVNNGSVENNWEGTHWSLLVYETKTKNFYHYDSLRGANYQYVQPLVKELLKVQEISEQEWANHYIARHETEQENGYDCGVAIISFIEKIIKKYCDSEQELGSIELGKIDFSQERNKWRETLVEQQCQNHAQIEQTVCTS